MIARSSGGSPARDTRAAVLRKAANQQYSSSLNNSSFDANRSYSGVSRGRNEWRHSGASSARAQSWDHNHVYRPPARAPIGSGKYRHPDDNGTFERLYSHAEDLRANQAARVQAEENMVRSLRDVSHVAPGSLSCPSFNRDHSFPVGERLYQRARSRDALRKEKSRQLQSKREAEELEALEEISRKAREEEETTVTVEEALKMSEAESVETPIQEERIKPDFTEVIEPESKGKHPKKNTVASLGQRIVESKTGKVVKPPKPTLSNWQRAELLDNFHKEHGNFEDVKEYVQNEEQNDNTLWQQVNKSKKKLTSEEEYHRRLEQRIEDLMLKVDNGELSLEDLTPEDRQVIIDIMNQNEV